VNFRFFLNILYLLALRNRFVVSLAMPMHERRRWRCWHDAWTATWCVATLNVEFCCCSSVDICMTLVKPI